MFATERRKNCSGFTLVELAVVVVIIGVLAAFAVPRFLASVERSKAAEAFNYLATIHSSQERYHARQGTYASDLSELDTELVDPEYFTVGSIAVPSSETDLETGWELALTRVGASAGYGAYTVIFNQDGFDGVNSTIDSEISPLQTSGT
jgi:prepilin-type N-terminal cleavage/methylation domain-containing protein